MKLKCETIINELIQSSFTFQTLTLNVYKYLRRVTPTLKNGCHSLVN